MLAFVRAGIDGWCEPRWLFSKICFLLHCFIWNSSILIAACNPVTFSLKLFGICTYLLRNVVNDKGENSLSKVIFKNFFESFLCNYKKEKLLHFKFLLTDWKYFSVLNFKSWCTRLNEKYFYCYQKKIKRNSSPNYNFSSNRCMQGGGGVNILIHEMFFINIYDLF